MSAEELAERLESIAEEIADLALDTLREASSRTEAMADPVLVRQERRLIRARNAVERAVVLLRPVDHGFIDET
jgi:hypothetical protein